MLYLSIMQETIVYDDQYIGKPLNKIIIFFIKVALTVIDVGEHCYTLMVCK